MSGCREETQGGTVHQRQTRRVRIKLPFNIKIDNVGVEIYTLGQTKQIYCNALSKMNSERITVYSKIEFRTARRRVGTFSVGFRLAIPSWKHVRRTVWET